MNPHNFFAELKRRNVYKVAVVYAVIAWLLIQAGSILFPTFEAPAWVMKVFVAVVLLGFPIALILAWALTHYRFVRSRKRCKRALSQPQKSRMQPANHANGREYFLDLPDILRSYFRVIRVIRGQTPSRIGIVQSL